MHKGARQNEEPFMSTNRFYKLIAASLICGAFCAASAMADVSRPEAYKRLTAVQLAPGHAPKLEKGFSSLSNSERAYGERLPLQLRGPVKKIESVRYIRVKAKNPKAKTVQF